MEAGKAIDLYIEGAGLSLPITRDGNGLFGHVEGSTGLGAIPRTTRIREGAADGGQYLGSRATTRPMVIKVAIQGTIDEQRAALVDLRNALIADDARLVVVRDDGTWTLPVVYESGLEGDLSHSTSKPWILLADIALTAPQPYWLLSNATVVEARVSDGAKIFLDDLAALPLSESFAIQDSYVTNQGDAPVPVVWLLRGPCGSAEVSIGGRGFSIPDGLTEGESILVDPTVLGMPAVTDQNGANAYTRLAMGPLFPLLPRGESMVHLAMSGAQAGIREKSDQILAMNWVTNPALRVNRDGWGVDDETQWAYAPGDPGRLDCLADMNDRPFLLPHWLYNAKADFHADAWYPDLQVEFTGGVATLVMEHTARKVCSVRAQDATLNWQNPYASITGTTYEVESYTSDGDKTFTITLADKSVNA
ncbi:MAG: hypothetical protein ABF792_08875, partial [Bifidobacterium psychraerophilum]|uniref:hypothetical protein n=1 Tax=Bifidobacterium psychraerophilum TaxID=218140 RepID=UPI0039EC9376